MKSIIFVIIFTLVNIILWIIMLVRFRKLFSTEKILEKARDEMNFMVKELDKVTERDIFLTSESSKRIQQQLKEADKKMEDFQSATDRLRSMIAEVDKYIGKNPGTKIVEPASSISSSTPAASVTSSRNDVSLDKGVQDYLAAGKKYKTTVNTIEDPLFAAANNNRETGHLNITNVMESRPMSQNRPPAGLNSKQNLSDKVKRLYTEGYDVTEIAAELSCSVTEVQFIIDML